jgi:hypothetical protein
MGAIFASVFTQVFLPGGHCAHSGHRALQFHDCARSASMGMAAGVAAGAVFVRGLPMVAYGATTLLYGISLLFPLLALLLFNSKRHREMRQKLLEVRHLRQAMIAELKAR